MRTSNAAMWPIGSLRSLLPQPRRRNRIGFLPLLAALGAVASCGDTTRPAVASLQLAPSDNLQWMVDDAGEAGYMHPVVTRDHAYFERLIADSASATSQVVAIGTETGKRAWAFDIPRVANVCVTSDA